VYRTYVWPGEEVARVRHAYDPLREARVAGIRQGICETIAPFDLRVGLDQDCWTQLHSVDLGMVRVVYASGERIDGQVTRTPRLIRRSDPEMCKIDFQLRGRAVVEQDDRQAELGPGAFGFVDLSRPCHLDGVAAVMFPRALLPLRYRDARELAGVSFDSGEATAALVGTVVREVTSRRDGYAAPLGDRVGAAILDLITAALSVRLDRAEAVPPDTRARVLTWQVKSFVEARLDDARLSPGQIAAAHHISRRHLYRMFEAEQTMVGSWIRGRRLDHCRRDLIDPALAGRTISAVAARWGFVDPTHFTRAFRAEYGMSPSEYRRLRALSTSDRYAVQRTG
jgi:AraC-like DNA-binding protein